MPIVSLLINYEQTVVIFRHVARRRRCELGNFDASAFLFGNLQELLSTHPNTDFALEVSFPCKCLPQSPHALLELLAGAVPPIALPVLRMEVLQITTTPRPPARRRPQMAPVPRATSQTRSALCDESTPAGLPRSKNSSLGGQTKICSQFSATSTGRSRLPSDALAKVCTSQFA